MSPLRLRPVCSLDFAQVANIAYQTGYFGDSAQMFFPDSALFGDLWIGPYTKLPSLLSTPEKAPGWKSITATRYSSFLAPLGLEEMELLQGNLVLPLKNRTRARDPGTGGGSRPARGQRGGARLHRGHDQPSPAQYQQALSRELVRVLGKLASGRYPRWRGCVAYLARAAFYPGPHLDQGAYPAHLHRNLLPQARGLGLGGRLLDSYLGVLRLGGVCGVQLSTTLENRSALALYQKRGFTVMAQRESDLWYPWLGRPVTRVAMGLTL